MKKLTTIIILFCVFHLSAQQDTTHLITVIDLSKSLDRYLYPTIDHIKDVYTNLANTGGGKLSIIIVRDKHPLVLRLRVKAVLSASAKKVARSQLDVIMNGTFEPEGHRMQIQKVEDFFHRLEQMLTKRYDYTDLEKAFIATNRMLQEDGYTKTNTVIISDGLHHIKSGPKNVCPKNKLSNTDRLLLVGWINESCNPSDQTHEFYYDLDSFIENIK